MKNFELRFLLAALLTVAALPARVSAQLLPEQRTFDFQNLVALYAKRYAPYDWKRQAFGFDLFDISPWLDRVRNAKDDLEFFEIEAEYVANLQDTHSGFQMPSTFRANLGMTVDIYDGKVLIDSINRSQLPAASYPFQIGDELISVDGTSTEDWIKRISTWRRYGNPASTRRLAAQQITFRAQSNFPRAVEIGDVANVEIRRANGALERYTIPWVKAGYPVTTVGPVPFPQTPSTDLNNLETLDELHNYKLPDNDLIRSYVTGIGSLLPVFRSGFPSNFIQRLGRSSGEFHYSGTYVSNGYTIGYLRFPSFTPTASALTELRNEIDYFQKNTDGLVVDVTRNPGGGCYMLDAAAALIPYPFYFFGEQIRATQDRLNSFQALLELAQLTRADQSVISAYQSYVDQVKAALLANRGMTAPIPACRQSGQTTAPTIDNNVPAPTVYTKPLIVLIDEFSISAADIFPSMIQDNKRALLVGTRTSGGGGSVSGWPTGFYSESTSSNTNTLVVRKNPIVTAEYPPAPYVENIGARPDIPLDFMTRDNLLTGDRPFVDQFTQVMVEEIRKELSKTAFAISNGGGVSLTTPGASVQPIIGYGRIQAKSGSTTPSGLAIFGYRRNGTLVSEAGVPAIAPILSGRIYAEISESVNTGLSIANPNNTPATISFYFTGVNGNAGAGTLAIAANGQLTAFLDQVPFNGLKPLAGTFTFSSSAPVAVTALRGLTNERGDFLITALPVVPLSGPAPTGTFVFPHFADGDGWATQIALINSTDSALTGTIQFIDQGGNPATIMVDGQTNSSFSYAIRARGSQSLRTSAAPRSIQAGSVRVVPAGNGTAPIGIAIFSRRKDGLTTAETGVQAAAGGSQFRLYAEATGDFGAGAAGSIQSGVAISNLSNTQASISLALNSFDGAAAALTGTILVPANGQTSKFLNQIPGFESLPLPFRGVLRISSTSPISVAGLRSRYNERNDFLITTTPPVNEATITASDDLFFPLFAEGGGYVTQFVLLGGSATQTASGTLRLVSQSGTALILPLR